MTITVPKRCGWATDVSVSEQVYHDEEWGVPSYDDQHMFEMLLLEGAQAGLSWSTILNKRENYRRAMDGFSPERIAGYDEQKKLTLMQDAGIVRNRLKIESAVINAQCFLEIAEQQGSFSEFIWQFVDGRPVTNHWKEGCEVPASTGTSDLMSRTLRKRGFKFVGSTICYAFMQAIGMVNDHTSNCFRYREICKGNPAA
jgi:DNA-3-methyladenine glycosylase I